MQTVTAPKGKSKMVITLTGKRSRGVMAPPSQTHRDKKAYAKRNACRGKGRNTLDY